MNATIASFHAMFAGCPEPTAIVEGTSIVARNAAFVSFFGEVNSLLDCVDPGDHEAVVVAKNPGTMHTRFTARLAIGEAAGTPMRWTTWALGEAMTCVRLDDEDKSSRALVEAQSLVRAIEQLPVAIWAMEKDGTCVLSTGSGLRELGLEPGWLVGKNLFEVYGARPVFASHMARVFTGEQVVTEAHIGAMIWRNHFVPLRGLHTEDVVRVYAVAENITERTQNERRLEEQLTLIKAQQHAIAILSCPVIEVWQGVLVVPLIGKFDESRAGSLVEQLLRQVVSRQARSVILDFTGVEMIDAATAPYLFNILRCVELLGARGLISGIRPNVAKTMVELDIPLAAKNAYATLGEALRKLTGARRNDAPKR